MHQSSVPLSSPSPSPAAIRVFGWRRLPRLLAVCALLLLPAAPGGAQGGGVDHGAFSTLLARHVRDGLVNYDAFRDSPEFAGYLRTLARTDPARLPRNEQLAFWINAYNAYTIAQINAHGERASIKNINKSLGFLKTGGAWSEPMATVGGTRYTLDQIEHERIRPVFSEPRVHFALVCAALGCPPLRSEAVRGGPARRAARGPGSALPAALAGKEPGGGRHAHGASEPHIRLVRRGLRARRARPAALAEPLLSTRTGEDIARDGHRTNPLDPVRLGTERAGRPMSRTDQRPGPAIRPTRIRVRPAMLLLAALTIAACSRDAGRDVVRMTVPTDAATAAGTGDTVTLALADVRKSQAASVSQRVANTDIAITYSRPVARGREIFGGIIPFGEVWNPGADQASAVTFSRPVQVNGQALAAGTYSVWGIPGATEWTLIFSRAGEVYHTPYPGAELDALRLTVPVENVPHTEVLTFDFPLVEGKEALLRLRWASTSLSVRVEVP